MLIRRLKIRLHFPFFVFRVLSSLRHLETKDYSGWSVEQLKVVIVVFIVSFVYETHGN